MINFENTQIYPVFKAIFQNKHVQTDYFAQNFQCNELENTITKTTNIYNYCDDFNEWFKQVHTIDIEHTIGEEKSLELGTVIYGTPLFIIISYFIANSILSHLFPKKGFYFYPLLVVVDVLLTYIFLWLLIIIRINF